MITVACWLCVARIQQWCGSSLLFTTHFLLQFGRQEAAEMLNAARMQNCS